jgi:flagellar motility protein MotE (MotC chaperone)
MESQNTKVRGLAKIYGTMKPKEAAKLMENLDDKLVMNIISTMTPDEAAAILSLMEVKKAAKISEALSGR